MTIETSRFEDFGNRHGGLSFPPPMLIDILRPSVISQAKGLTCASATRFSSSLFCFCIAAAQKSLSQTSKPPFKLQEVMIPVRDGVHLQTAILTPVDHQGPLPILFRRTPYGVPEKAPEQMPSSWKELAEDGYIFVIQNLRGRFKSEGYFDLPLRSI